VKDQDIYAMINAHWQPLSFDLPAIPWRRVVDTPLASPDDIVPDAAAPPVPAAPYELAARSIAVLIGNPSG
jgi:glycogen operon protein